MNRSLPTVVISDIDSTIANTEHRHYIAESCIGTDNWDEYVLKCIDDEPITGSIATLRLLYPSHRIHLVSGRSEIAREPTLRWLEYYQVPFDELHLYNEHEWLNKPHNWQIKVRHVLDLRAKGLQPVLFLEDWPDIVKEIEKLGVPVLCVNPRYDSPPVTYL